MAPGEERPIPMLFPPRFKIGIKFRGIICDRYRINKNKQKKIDKDRNKSRKIEKDRKKQKKIN